MNLDEYLSLFNQTTDHPSLDGTKYIMNYFNNPHDKLKFIHVAGTNGKGSICEMLSKILINSNYKVGKFMTPHLICSNESICINNSCITDLEISKYITKMDIMIKDFEMVFKRLPTRFEVLTSISILYFFDNYCDIVVLEVGLGGRFDCTNVVTPIVSAFGSISFDHTAILGNTLEKIAFEKAGIIKENSNSVIYDQKALPIIEEICIQKNNLLTVIKNEDILNYDFDNNFQYFDYKDLKNITINLKGRKQIENACIVIETINILNENGFSINTITIIDSLKQIIHPARFETLKTDPLIIFDGAHNENAMMNFVQTVHTYYPNKTKTFIISIIKTKDYASILKHLLLSFPNDKFVFTNGVTGHDFFSSTELFEFSKKIRSSKTIYTNSFEKAIYNTNSEANFIIGSFYTYKHACDILK